MLYFVYKLIDPRDNTTFYIGITNNPNKRMMQHLLINSNDKKYTKIHEIQEEGLTPTMQIIEMVDGKEAALERETYWIKEALANNTELTNEKKMSESFLETQINTVIKPRPSNATITQPVKTNNTEVWEARQKVGDETYYNTSYACDFIRVQGTKFLYVAECFGLSKTVVNNTNYYKLSELQACKDWLATDAPGWAQDYQMRPLPLL